MPKIIQINTQTNIVKLQHMNESVEEVPFNQLPCDYAEYLTPAILLSELSFAIGQSVERAYLKTYLTNQAS